MRVHKRFFGYSCYFQHQCELLFISPARSMMDGRDSLRVRNEYNGVLSEYSD
jgi:hypothetical protein